MNHMNTEQKLTKIREKCVELLAIAEKRTDGRWESFQNWVTIRALDVAKTFTGNKEKDAKFIASCAGPAEAGWKATIAAIDAVVKLKKEIDCGWKTMCLSIGVKDYEEERDFWPEHADKIISAWEGLL